MQPWQTRVLHEKKGLDERVKKLDEFTCTGDFDRLPEQDRADLDEQLLAMRLLQSILARRMARF